MNSLENEIPTETLSNEFSLTFTNYLGGSVVLIYINTIGLVNLRDDATWRTISWHIISQNGRVGDKPFSNSKISSSQMRVHQTKFHLNGYRMKR